MESVCHLCRFQNISPKFQKSSGLSFMSFTLILYLFTSLQSVKSALFDFTKLFFIRPRKNYLGKFNPLLLSAISAIPVTVTDENFVREGLRYMICSTWRGRSWKLKRFLSYMRFLQLRFSVIYAVLEIIIVCHICAFIGNNFCSNFEKKKKQ